MAVPPSDAAQIAHFYTSSAFLQGQLGKVPTKPIGQGNARDSVATSNIVDSKGANPEIEQASRAFEALLLSFMYKAMRQTVPKSEFFGKGRDRSWYSQLFDIELAQSLTRGGGLGLSTYLQQHLQRVPGKREGQLDTASHGQGDEGKRTPPVPSNHRHPTTTLPPVTSIDEMIPPIFGRITSYHGLRLDPFIHVEKFHQGIDIAGPIGTEIRAARAGTVAFNGWKEGYGLTLILSHADGYTTQYSHNSKNLVQVGESVKQGETIALVGQSGRATGPHVHFEVKKNGKPIDPTPLLTKKAVS